jgi:hypothetical protein
MPRDISTNGQKYVTNVTLFFHYDIHLLTVKLADLTENFGGANAL